MPSFTLQSWDAQPIVKPEPVFLQEFGRKYEMSCAQPLTCSVCLKKLALIQTVYSFGFGGVVAYSFHISVFV